METSSDNPPPLTDISKRIAQRAFVIFENRLQLLMVEAQQERERVLRAITLTMVAATFGLLTGVAITAFVAVAFWDSHPLVAIGLLAAFYAGGAVLFFFKLVQLQRDWHALPATIDQLRKDRECLEKYLG